ncbi:MAG: hypothetical protein K2W96_18275 [Gemmataceae bacterium]|nr:hypothetical protein [Gemmataceae bacterium]
MIDAVTKKPMKVWGTTGLKTVSVPLTQLDSVRKLFDANNIFYWVSDTAVSFDNHPPRISVEISRREDLAKVQALLDGAA